LRCALGPETFGLHRSEIDFGRVGSYRLSNLRRPVAAGEAMPRPSSTRINRLLADWGRGNEQAREALILMVYDELRRVARRHLRREHPDHTFQSAAFVNEAYLRRGRDSGRRRLSRWPTAAGCNGMVNWFEELNCPLPTEKNNDSARYRHSSRRPRIPAAEEVCGSGWGRLTLRCS
jgi:ECF sigma factor